MRTKIWIPALALMVALVGCSETDEATDDENDIIVRNYSEDDVWVDVDGFNLTRVDDDGRAEEVAEDVPDGRYLLRAYADEARSEVLCEVETGYLEDGEDFYWYLDRDEKYSGSKHGDC